MTSETVGQGAEAVRRASADSVRLECSAAVARIVLNRPDKFNAIGSAMLAGLRRALEWAVGELTVRAIVLSGEGRGFSAGGDLDEVAELVQDTGRLDAFFDFWHGTLERFESCPLPVVAAVHGAALAGGLELVEACDFVVVGDRTVIGDQHANFGLFPAGGSTQRLPRLIPPRQAKWLLMSGETISPDAALQFGLVNRVVAEQDVFAEALSMASTLATRSPAATGAIKEAVRRGMGLPLYQAIAAERDLAIAQQTSQDAQLGFAAFRARAKPEFARRK